MSESPFRNLPLEKKVAVLIQKVGELERKARTAGATTLDGLRDTEVLYDHWTDLPKLDQALRWDTDRESKYHGLATFADPTVVDDYFTEPITGAGTFGLDDGGSPPGEFLVDSDWDASRPCLVTATASFNGTYTSQVAVAAAGGVPALLTRSPVMNLSVIDGDTGRVTTPGAGYEVATVTWAVNPTSGFTAGTETTLDSKTRTVSWLFLRGRPKVQASCVVDTAAAPGLSGSPEILVITRCTRL